MDNSEIIAQDPVFQPRPGIQGMATAYLAACLAERTKISASGCWVWQRTTNKAGYGLVDLKYWEWPESVASVHRIAYRLCVGPIPPEMCVCHHCDNPSCVRPDHLFLGTNQDNINDKMSKGRHRSPCGERHGACRLTAEVVVLIRHNAAKGESASALAKRHSISETTVRDIVSRRTWKHLAVDLILGHN